MENSEASNRRRNESTAKLVRPIKPNSPKAGLCAVFLLFLAFLFCGTWTVVADTCISPPDGLVSWWRGDGNGLDAAGNNNGSLAGEVAYETGRVGQGFSFNGSNEWINVDNPTNLQLQDFTVEAWIKRGDTTLASFQSGGGAIFGTGLYGYCIGLFDNGQVFLADTGVSAIQSDLSITDTNYFHHIAVTKSGSNVVFYVDGICSAPQTYANTFAFAYADTIGAALAGHNTFLGMIDELAIYNRPLSAAEIQNIYNAQSEGKCHLPIAIITQPASHALYVGDTVLLNVGATGGELNFQWSCNGTNIARGTNYWLALENVQQSDAGSYSVLVSDANGQTNSNPAVVAVSLNPPCAALPDGLVSWWRGEGNMTDEIGGNSGTNIGSVNYVNGRVGQGFQFNGTGGVDLGKVPLNLKIDTFSIEAWIKRGNAAKASFDAGGGVIFKCGNGGYSLKLSDDGQLILPDLSIAPSFRIIDTNIFHHIVWTRTGYNSALYADGTILANCNCLGSFSTGRFQFTGSATIGAAANGKSSFIGAIDELAVFNRVLSSNEVQSLYNAHGSGKCGSPFAPSIRTQPLGHRAFIGAAATFSTAAMGTPPFSYQWSFNHVPLVNATNCSLALNNVQTNQAGSYSVVITNATGSVTSRDAVLAVVPLPVDCMTSPTNLIHWWQAEGNASDSLGTANGIVSSGVTYISGQVANAFQFDGSRGQIDFGPDAGNFGVNDFTMSFWVETSSTYENQDLLEKRPDCNGDENFFSFSIGNPLTGLGLLSFVICGDDATNFSGLESSIAINDGIFHHVALMRQGATLSLYLDGVLNESVNTPGIANINNASDLLVGQSICNFYGGPQPFSGALDELAVFNRALSSSEIAALYDAGSYGQCPISPAILSPISSQLVNVGDSVTLPVAVAGSPALSFQWNVHGANISGAKDSSLTLNNVQTNDAGIYFVQVTNAAGVASGAVAALLVKTVSGQLINPMPSLSISAQTNAVTLAWPFSPIEFDLQTATNFLSPANWTDVIDSVTTNNGSNAITIPVSNQFRFYRLQPK